MAFWNKPTPTPPQPHLQPNAAPAPQPSAPAQRVTLQNPNRSDNDPQQLMYRFFNSAMAFVYYGPLPVEQLLARMVRITPALGQSHRMGSGLFLQFNNDLGVWAATDGPRGSALAIWITNDSAAGWFFSNFLKATDTLPSPLQRDLTGQGQVDAGLAQILETSDVVPVWETPEFRHLDDGSGFPALPASIRRAARSWESQEHVMYQKKFVDSDGDEVIVFLGIDSYLDLGTSNMPTLIYNLGPFFPGRPFTVFTDLIKRGPYYMSRMGDEQENVVLLRSIPLGIDAAALDQAAQTMTNDFAAFNKAIGSRKTPPLPERDTRSVWSRLEEPPSATRASCPISWPTTPVPFTVVERIRYNVDSNERTFESINQDAQRLIALRETGFEYAVRDPDDELLKCPGNGGRGLA